MRFVLFLLCILLTAPDALAQHTLRITVKNEESKQPVAGATVALKDTDIRATTDAAGNSELTN
ncbi:MAG TPA: hypothetical protein VJZ91_18455, partial [Blastocatellia bacterium]|nr:hypothetical protein [Blastocatellia bacterium]